MLTVAGEHGIPPERGDTPRGGTPQRDEAGTPMSSGGGAFLTEVLRPADEPKEMMPYLKTVHVDDTALIDIKKM